MIKIPNEGQDGEDENNVFQKIWSGQSQGQEPWLIIDDEKEPEEQWLGPKISLGMLRNSREKKWRVREMEKRMFLRAATV